MRTVTGSWETEKPVEPTCERLIFFFVVFELLVCFLFVSRRLKLTTAVRKQLLPPKTITTTMMMAANNGGLSYGVQSPEDMFESLANNAIFVPRGSAVGRWIILNQSKPAATPFQARRSLDRTLARWLVIRTPVLPPCPTRTSLSFSLRHGCWPQPTPPWSIDLMDGRRRCRRRGPLSWRLTRKIEACQRCLVTK